MAHVHALTPAASPMPPSPPFRPPPISIPAYFTPLSFNTSTSPDLGPELRARYNATAPVATPFAAFVCDGIAADAAGAAAGASAARAPADGDGPGAADAAAAPAEAAAAAAGNPAVVGTWRFVNSSSGERGQVSLTCTAPV